MNLLQILHTLITLIAVPILLLIAVICVYAEMSSDSSLNLLPSGAYPGDSVVSDAIMVYDQTRLIKAPPEAVWPWVLQVGKGRGGWYTPSSWEFLLPQRFHATRTIHAEHQNLKPGDIVPDYGFSSEDYFIVEEVHPNEALVYKSDRYGAHFSWSLILHPVKDTKGILSDPDTLLHLRFRGKIAATGLKRRALVWGGGVLDQITTAPMLAGLAERAEKGWRELQAKIGKS